MGKKGLELRREEWNEQVLFISLGHYLYLYLASRSHLFQYGARFDQSVVPRRSHSSLPPFFFSSEMKKCNGQRRMFRGSQHGPWKSMNIRFIISHDHLPPRLLSRLRPWRRTRTLSLHKNASGPPERPQGLLESRHGALCCFPLDFPLFRQ